MLLPPYCPVCERLGPAPCATCIAAMRPAPVLPPPPGLDSCGAVLVYDGAARRLLARLKYGNARSSVPWLARAMVEIVDTGVVDVVTWVPTTGARRRRRGYDQAQVLARAVARQAGLPCRRLLSRRPGPAQTGQSREARWHRPSFAARPRRGGRVLVVDDIVTTGATMAAAAAALRAAGAGEVRGIAAATTLLKAARAASDGPSDETGGAPQPSSPPRRGADPARQGSGPRPPIRAA